MKTFPIVMRMLVLAAFTVLADCGGGGGGGGGSPALAPTPAPAASSMSFSKTVIPLSPSAEDIAVADFDGRNGPDIAVQGSYGDLEIFLNRGDGTFESSSSRPPACPASGGMSLFAGQFSAGTNIDLLIVCADLNEGFKRYRGFGDGSFANVPDTVTVPLPVGPFFNPLDTIFGAGGHLFGRVQLGAFGGEGQALTYVEWIPPDQTDFILCFFRVNELISNFDAGGAYLPLCSNSFNVPGPVTFDPVTGEPLPSDPVTVFAETRVSSSYLLAAPPFSSPENAALTFPLTHDNNFPLAGDLRVVGYNPGCSLTPNYVECFSVEEYLYPHAIPGVYGQAAGDFNRDGVPEIVALTGDYNFAVFAVEPSQEIQPGVRLIADPLIVATDPALGYPSFLTVADFDGDGKLDVAVLTDHGAGTAMIQIFHGNGDGTFGAAQSFPTDYESGRFIVADLNGDGRPDLVNLNATNSPATGPEAFLTIHLNTTPTP
jgi:VCBS repeat protein